MPFSGYQDFQDPFGDALQRMIGERPSIYVKSGYRTPQRQAELFADAIAKYGSVAAARHHVAPAPGTYGSQGSRHNWGVAADLGYGPGDEQWAHENAARFGLNFRMGHEPWHIELVGGKPTAVGNESGQPIANADPKSQQNPITNSISITEQREPLYDWRRDIRQDPQRTPVTAMPEVKVTDVNELLELLSPKQKESSQKLLDKIRGYNT